MAQGQKRSRKYRKASKAKTKGHLDNGPRGVKEAIEKQEAKRIELEKIDLNNEDWE